MIKLNKLCYVLLALLLGGLSLTPAMGQNISQAQELSKDTLLANVLSDNLDRKYSYYYLEGVLKKNTGNLDDAFQLFNHCIAIDSTQADAYYQLGSMYMQLNQADKALNSFRKSIAIDSLNYWYNESYFISLYNASAKDMAPAIAQLEAMTRRFPNKTQLQFQLFELYSQSREYDKMISVLDQLESKMGKSEQLSMQKFRVYLMKGEEDKAYAEMLALVEACPNDLRYRVVLADLYLTNGKKKQAYSLLKKVLEQEPDFPMAVYALASYYQQTNQDKEYLDQVQKIIFNPKAEDELRLNLIRQYISNPKVDSLDVIALFDKALELDVEDDQIPMLYAQYLYTQNMQDQAKPVLERVIKIDPSNTPSRLMLLGLAIKADDYKEVITLCQGGILASPSTLEFYYYLAIAYNQAESYDKLIEVVESALNVVDETTPKELISDFYAIMGDAYHSLGKTKELYQAYEKALELNPENLGVLNNYAYYLSVEKRQLDKAEQMSKKTVDAEPSNATFLDTYAWILFELNRFTQAKVFIDTALQHGGQESGVVVEHAGDIYWKVGQKDKAIELWLQADKLGAGPKIKEKIKKRKYISE